MESQKVTKGYIDLIFCTFLWYEKGRSDIESEEDWYYGVSARLCRLMPFFGPLQPFSLCSSLLTLPSSLAMFHDCVPSLSLFSTHTSHASLMRQGSATFHRKRTWRCPSCDAADDSILEPSKPPTVGLT